jgi:enolase
VSKGTKIISVTARQVYTERGHPGIEAKVTTENGAAGVAVCTAGVSIGEHEIPFKYDGGPKFRGKGVTGAVAIVNEVIAPALRGLDSSRQLDIDHALLNLGGPDAKARLGGNATAAVSAAALKAGAASLGQPLYQHIGGVNACIMPVPGVLSVVGNRRYGGLPGNTNKPSYSFYCYGFGTYSEASYAAWECSYEFTGMMRKRFGLEPAQDGRVYIPAGLVKHERELWDIKMEVVSKLGYEGRVGFQVDMGATTYYDAAKGCYTGLLSAGEKTEEEMGALYDEMVHKYAFVIIEDPLHEDDYEGHAKLTKRLGIQIVGDDLFTTTTQRVEKGATIGAANCVLLKVNQIGTISEAFDMVQFAYRNGYGVMPCSSRGEGSDIADYTVGLSCGHLREGAIGETGNRLSEIEAELGPRAKFLGRKGFKGG